MREAPGAVSAENMGGRSFMARRKVSMSICSR